MDFVISNPGENPHVGPRPDMRAHGAVFIAL